MAAIKYILFNPLTRILLLRLSLYSTNIQQLRLGLNKNRIFISLLCGGRWYKIYARKFLNELIFYVVTFLIRNFSVPRLLRLFTKFRRKNLIILLILISSFLSLSCSFYRGFTTYFNIIYLARQHLEIY